MKTNRKNEISTWGLGILCFLGVFTGVVFAQLDQVFIVAEGSGYYNSIYRYNRVGGAYNGIIADSSGLFYSIATDDHYLLIGDSSDEIRKFLPNGVFEGVFADTTGLMGSLTHPSKIELDNLKNLYTCPSGASSKPRTSLRYDLFGNLTGTFAHTDLVFPVGIDADSYGNVYIVNSAGVGVGIKLFVFNSSGGYIGMYSIPETGSPADIAIDEFNQLLYIADDGPGVNGPEIKIYDISNISPSYFGAISIYGISSGASGLSFDSDSSTLFVVSRDDGVAVEITTNGTIVHSYDVSTLEYVQDIVRLESPGTPPITEDIGVETEMDTPVTVTLIATDDGVPDPPGAISYIITSLPEIGTLSDPEAGVITSVPYTLAGGNEVLYTPNAGSAGTDSFEYKANDGGMVPVGGDSNISTVNILSGVTTVNYAVSASGDDGYAYSTTSTAATTTSYLRIGDGSYSPPFYMSGMRFLGVNIPKNSTIVSAYLKICSYTYYLSGNVYGIIEAEATGNASSLSGRIISTAPKTSHSVNWDHTSSWSSSAWYTSPDISAVIQEIVNREDWAANNAMAVYYSTRLNNEVYRYYSSFDRGSSYAPQIEITYFYQPPESPKIFGYITEPDSNIPVENVLIEASNGGGSDITDANGYYELTVDYGWSGVIEPNRSGWIFTPNQYDFTNVTSDICDANYVATMIRYSISGYVFDDVTAQPVADVNVFAENGGGYYTSRYGGGSDVTDANGFYEMVVDYNFVGKVTPNKYAYSFEPNSIDYFGVMENASNQNYIAKLLTYSISGYILNDCAVAIEGVAVDANNGGSSGITDVNGYYEIWVDYAWSGAVTPAKTDYTFNPPVISYVGVLADIVDSNYIAINIYDLNCDGVIGLGDISVMGDNWLETGQDIPGDLYRDDDDIVNFLDFTDFVNHCVE